MNIFPQMSVVFKQFLLLISSVMLGEKGGGGQLGGLQNRRQCQEAILWFHHSMSGEMPASQARLQGN